MEGLECYGTSVTISAPTCTMVTAFAATSHEPRPADHSLDLQCSQLSYQLNRIMWEMAVPTRHRPNKSSSV